MLAGLDGDAQVCSLASLAAGFLRPSAAGIARGGIPLRTPLARVPAEPRLPNPIEHTRPRGIHAPGHSFGVIQTMLLALPNFGLERMGREKPLQIENLMRPAAGRIFGFLRAKHAQESISGVAAAVLSAPIARRNEASLTGPPGWTGRGSWRRMRLTIRGRRQ